MDALAQCGSNDGGSKTGAYGRPTDAVTWAPGSVYNSASRTDSQAVLLMLLYGLISAAAVSITIYRSCAACRAYARYWASKSGIDLNEIRRCR
jgi:hypothetical protein